MNNKIKKFFQWNYHKIFYRSTVERSKSFWKNNYSAYQGKRVFIICNGPSLNVNDLNMLKNEYTIASNKIYLVFDETDWRPTFLTSGDKILWKKINKEIYDYFSPVILISNNFDYSPDQTLLIKNLGKSQKNDDFSFNMLNGAFGSRTITFQNIQIAAHLGFKEIYLIGCDHFYNEEKVNNTQKSIHSNEIQNHFHPNYRQEGEVVNYAPIKIMNDGYKLALKRLSEANIKIFNASRKTKLDILPQINFDTLF